MRILLCLAGLLLLCACTPSHHWVKPGASGLDARQTYRACETETLMRYGGWVNVEPFTAGMEIRECMQLHGYALARIEGRNLP